MRKVGYNNEKVYLAYLNSRPFLHSEMFPALHYLNLGTSFGGGYEQDPAPQPDGFRTANDQTTASSVVDTLSPTWFKFNDNVSLLGTKFQWAAHLAYYYKSLMFLSEMAYGFEGYSTDGVHSISVPNQGWFVHLSYFPTGEEPTRRVNIVRPLHNFSLKPGKEGPGAIELQARYSEMSIGNNIFTTGLADANLWTNRAAAIDVGVNWYWNYYTKFQLDWQHAMYDDPVSTGVPGHYMRASDLYWLRFQIFF